MLTVETLTDIVNKAIKETIEQFADTNLQASDLAVSLIDLTNDAQFDFIANYRGEEPIFPASIVKLFYLAAVHRWLEDNKLKDTAELRSACADMIVDSSNDATHYILDLLTDTTAGPELEEKEMVQWAEKRNIVNRYFRSLGYQNININQKTWGDGPYGRERVFVGKEKENRNKLTTNATARLLAEIVTGKHINEKRSKAMLDLLSRDFTKPSGDVDNQATGFMGGCLPVGAKLWSKAGWMSTARHDAAYIELPNAIRFVLVVFVSNHARDYWILPTIAKKIIRALESLHQAKPVKLR